MPHLVLASGMRCSITAAQIRKLGSRREIAEGDADGMSTNIGLVGAEGLERYDEAIRRIRGRAGSALATHKLVRDELFGFVSRRFQRILFESGYSAFPPTNA